MWRDNAIHADNKPGVHENKQPEIASGTLQTTVSTSHRVTARSEVELTRVLVSTTRRCSQQSSVMRYWVQGRLNARAQWALAQRPNKHRGPSSIGAYANVCM